MRRTELSFAAYAVLVVLGLVLSLLMFFPVQLRTGFSVVFSNSYDGVIQVALVGHWYKVLIGLQRWNEIPYFYPHRDTLGYNDGVFLTGMLAAPFRAAGVDLFRAHEYALVALKAVGFISMAALLNRIVAKNSWTSVAGAVLFSVMIGTSNQAYHAQLLSLSLAPLATLLLFSAWQHHDGSIVAFLGRAAAFLAIIGGWLITSFYMAWFYLLLICIVVAVHLAFERETWRHIVRQRGGLRPAIVAIFRRRGGRYGGLAVLALISLVPFALVYGPKLRETHGHNIHSALAYALDLTDAINIGSGSLIWGGWFAALKASMPDRLPVGEFEVGFTPDVLGVLAAIMVLAAFTKRLQLTPLLRATLWGAVLLAALPLSIHGISPWWVVFRTVPGATGVRVIARVWLLIGFPVSIMLTVALDRIAALSRWRLAAVPLAAVLITSQYNTTQQVALRPDAEMKLLAEVPTPPPSCRSFVLIGAPTETESHDPFYGFYHDNVLAMLVADHINLPTLNGFATFKPADWDFSAIPPDTVLTRFARYVKAHGLDHVCVYETKLQRWDTNAFLPR